MIVKALFLAFVCVQLSNCCFKMGPKTPKLTSGSVIVTKIDNVVYHTYSSSLTTGLEVDTHIIELPTKLVIFDAQFQLPNAEDVLEYANYLKKPIDRIIISHSHPDHWFGLDVFKNRTKIYALRETIEEIKATGQAIIDYDITIFGDKVPKKPTIPDSVVTDGKETIDGVLFTFKKVINTESANSLIVTMPIQKIALVGDFVFNKNHMYLAEKNFDNWIKELELFKTEFDGYKLLLGHTKPAIFDVVQKNIDYLKTVKMVYGRSPNFSLFKTAMIEAYPNLDGRFILDLANDALYPTEG